MKETDEYYITEELKPASEALEGIGATYGLVKGPDIEPGRISLRIGRRPIALPLLRLMTAQGRKISSQFERLLMAYEPWLICYSVGIQDTGAWQTVSRFGLKIRILDEETAAVASVFPETQFLDLGSGKAVWKASVGVSGGLDESDAGSAGIPKSLQSLEKLLAGSDISVKVSTKADVAIELEFTVLTPLIIATGQNDDLSQWTFTQAPSDLLRGDQTVGHIVLLPKPASDTLKVEGSLFADIGLLNVFTKRYMGEPIKLNVLLRDIMATRDGPSEVGATD